MYEDMCQPYPAEMLTWAKNAISRLNKLDVAQVENEPLIGIVVAVGIMYGVRSRVERIFLAYPKAFSPHNTELLVRRIVLQDAMRRYNADTMPIRVLEGTCGGKRYYYGEYVVLVAHRSGHQSSGTQAGMSAEFITVVEDTASDLLDKDFEIDDDVLFGHFATDT